MEVSGGGAERRTRGRTHSSYKNFVINLPHLLAQFPERLPKLLRRGKSASDRNAIKRGIFSRQDGLSFKTPAAQNAFHPAQLPVAFDELIGVPRRQGLRVPGALQGG